MSWWFNVCHTGLETFEERLTFDDVVAEDEATQVGVRAESSHAIVEPKLSSRQRRRRYINYVYKF